MTDESDGYLHRFLSAAFTSGDQEEIGTWSTPGADAAPDDSDPELLGRYPVAERLGQGGVGQVYRAYDPDLGREVAVKALRRELAHDRRAVERFLAEARLCSTLQHPGIVPIHELGRLDDDRPYFTMKIVEGETLDAHLRRDRRGASRRLLQVFGRVCETIAFVHSHDVIHADLKPQNIMVGAFGEVQVLDFGFARPADPETGDAGLTAPSSSRSRIAGTPSYMAPEQARGDDTAISKRTDVFGLGAILLEILTGEAPFQGATKSEVLLRASKGWLDEALRRVERDVEDPTLRSILKDCLAADPMERPEDADQVARRIADHLASLEERVRRSELDAAEARAETRHEKRVRRLTLLLAAATMLAIVVPAALFLRGERQRSARRATADRGVADAMARAAVLADLARTDPLADHGRWAEALVAARLAEARAATPDASEAVKAESARMLGEIEDGHATAIERERIVEGLARLHPHGSIEAPEELEAGYRAAFRELGIDPDRDPADDAAALVSASNAGAELQEALVQWTHVRRRHHVPNEEAWVRPLEVAMRAEPDPARRDVLRAFRDGDTAALRRMSTAAARDPALQSALGLLARCQAELGERETAITLYRRASLARPEDYWTSHDLASRLLLLDEPPLEEVVRLYSMALAMRPGSAHALTDLGRTLFAMGDATDAEPLLRRAVAAAPDDSRAQFVLGMILLRLRDFDDAITSLSVASRNGQEAATLPLIGLLVERGSLAEAHATLMRATRSAPKQRDMLLPLANALLTQGEVDGAERLVRLAIERSFELPRAHSLLGLIHAEHGRFDDAEAACTRSTELSQDPALHVNHERLAHLMEASRAAVDALPRAEARLDAGDAFELDTAADVAMLGVTALRVGRADLAARLYRLVAETEPRGPASIGLWRRASRAAAQHASEHDGEEDAEEREAWVRRAFAWSTAGVTAAHEGAMTGTLDPAAAMSETYLLFAEPRLRRLLEEPGLPEEADGWALAVDRATAELADMLAAER